jgi:hypothetical protein
MLSQQQEGENTALPILGKPPEMLQESSERDRESPKLSGSKFIKQASSYLDSSPKAEH